MSTNHFRPWYYAVALIIAVLVAAATWLFFVIGLGDGTVSSFNIMLWLGLLALVSGVVAIGLVLRKRGHVGAAMGVLCLLAVPGALYGLFIILILVLQPRWN